MFPWHHLAPRPWCGGLLPAGPPQSSLAQGCHTCCPVCSSPPQRGCARRGRLQVGQLFVFVCSLQALRCSASKSLLPEQELIAFSFFTSPPCFAFSMSVTILFLLPIWVSPALLPFPSPSCFPVPLTSFSQTYFYTLMDASLEVWKPQYVHNRPKHATSG